MLHVLYGYRLDQARLDRVVQDKNGQETTIEQKYNDKSAIDTIYYNSERQQSTYRVYIIQYIVVDVRSTN